MADTYDFKAVEAKWQKEWENKPPGAVTNTEPGQKMYVLDMFPYPSGDGLHVGHAKIYTASDIVARYLRMKGFAVLHPTGWDAFGLPTENSAIKLKMHPADLTARNIDRFRGQMKRLGLAYDWEREINTSDPFYYKWTQWIFLQLYRMGLAYEATVPINWCPSCKTGLANEEVIDGKCERCGTAVEQKPMRQWMLRITRYAEQLLKGLTGLDWPESIIDMQRNWIGKSEGAFIRFGLPATEFIEVFTTRPDTLYGVTYVVLAPEHPLVAKVVSAEQRSAVEEYQQAARGKTERTRAEGAKEKTGIFTGGFAAHPLTHKPIPIWISDYVLASYGTGAVMAVPAHDERDYAFATHFNLPLAKVVEAGDVHAGETMPYMGEGVLVDSEAHSGQTTEQARGAIIQQLQIAGLGRKAVTYKLRDWVFSRQRYWGEPIPIIHCAKCGTVPVPEADLPVTLPDVEHYEPTGTGESPLAAMTEWVEVKCPTCPNMARRETNTMPQWAGSSWYWMRFADPRNNDELASREALQRWLPVDMYIGGAEHAVLHLLYARFWNLVLHDAGVVAITEPFKRLRNVGLVRGEDGQKMSKSRGNVINPDQVINEFGADALRLYTMFMGPFEASVAWDTSSIAGVHRFLQRVWRLVGEAKRTTDEPPREVQLAVARTIKRVSEGIEQCKFNTGIAALMELLNILEKEDSVPVSILETYVLLLSPFAPHAGSELWQTLGRPGVVHKTAWPAFQGAILEQAERTYGVQVNGKVRGSLTAPPGATQAYIEEQARALPAVARHIGEAPVIKVIFVPDRLINFVVGSSEAKK